MRTGHAGPTYSPVPRWPGPGREDVPAWSSDLDLSAARKRRRDRVRSSDATAMMVGEFAGSIVGPGPELPAAAMIRQPLFRADCPAAVYAGCARRPRRPGGLRRAARRPDRSPSAASTAIPAPTTPRSPSSSRTPTRAAAWARCCSSTSPPPPASAGSRTSSPRCWPRTAGWCGSSRTPATRPSGPTRTASST